MKWPVFINQFNNICIVRWRWIIHKSGKHGKSDMKDIRISHCSTSRTGVQWSPDCMCMRADRKVQ